MTLLRVPAGRLSFQLLDLFIMYRNEEYKNLALPVVIPTNANFVPFERAIERPCDAKR